ncbi:dihydrofolate reductase [bacterium]|nr:dihydrofolate reductase [bacterium]
MQKILVVASSLDGYIAQRRDQVSTAWTSEADRHWFGQISKEIGILIMGLTTYQTIGRPLPGRRTIVLCERGAIEAPEVTDFSLTSEAALYQSAGMEVTAMLQLLEERGVQRVAICGGASVYQSFLQAGLVDEIYLTLEPVFLGGGIQLVGEKGLKQPQKWQVIERQALSEQTIVFHLRKE